jgi:hypothetical protein
MYYDGRYTVSVPPYLVVDMDNCTASPLAGSFMRTVGKILVFMRQWLWDRCRSQTYNPNVRRCPRLSASGGHSPTIVEYLVGKAFRLQLRFLVSEAIYMEGK